MITTLDLIALLAGSAAHDAAWAAHLEGRPVSWLPTDYLETAR